MDANQQDRFSPTPSPQRKSGSWLPTCLIGCLVGSLVLLLLCGGGIWYLLENFRPLSADFARRAAVEGIQSSELTDEDKKAVIAQVDRVANAYKSGEIGLEELRRIFEELSESPLFGLFIVYAADSKYLQPSGLSEEEKQNGRLTLQRIARGVFEQQIDPEQLDDALDHISDQTADGNRQFHDQVSDAALRDFLAECQRLADQADVPMEPYELDIGKEFQKAIDRALGEEQMTGEEPASGE